MTFLSWSIDAHCDIQKMDKKALGRNRKLTEEALLTEQSGRSAIKGRFKEVYFLPKGDHWTVNARAYAVFSNSKQLRQTIGVDTTAAIAAAEAELQRVREDLTSEQREESRLEHEHTSIQQKWNRAKKECRSNDAMIEKKTEEIRKIKEAMENSEEDNVDTSAEEDDVRGYVNYLACVSQMHSAGGGSSEQM